MPSEVFLYPDDTPDERRRKLAGADPASPRTAESREDEALTAEEEAALRPRHIPYETGFFGGNPPDLACRQCSRPWPCDGSRLLATLDAARDQAATEARRELRAALREVDELASLAHDYIAPREGETPPNIVSTNAAIWRIHEIVRPLIEEGVTP